MGCHEPENLTERLCQFERLLEATAPPPANPAACRCDRCRYGPRYVRREDRGAA